MSLKDFIRHYLTACSKRKIKSLYCKIEMKKAKKSKMNIVDFNLNFMFPVDYCMNRKIFLIFFKKST